MARPSGVRLDDVVEAAAHLADANGVDQLTLAALAERLGIRSPSLYTHINGLAGLRRTLQLHATRMLADRLQHSAAAEPATVALREVARAYRAFAREHPGLFASLLPAPRPGDDNELYEAMAEPAARIGRLVTDVGVPEQHVVATVRALLATVHGFVTLELGGGFGMPEDVDDSFEVLLDILIQGIASTARGTGGSVVPKDG